MFDVSIIIPAFCRNTTELQWYEECVGSALSQDCEVVVYNDGSTVPLERSKYEPHVLIDGHQNRGVSHARNQAVMAATKSLILPLDSDDTLKPGAVEKLLSYWNGSTPVYPDVAKFGLEIVPHYALLDFDCSHILTHVGFSSVNVLHLKSQWVMVGGWDEAVDFYEDGLYNAMLFSRWCGRRYPEPLVNYRQHESQRTKIYKLQSAKYAKSIMDRIRRLEMACSTCSGRKTRMLNTAVNPAVPMAAMADPNSLPGSQGGRILARYVGGQGKGRHYYQGPSTKYNYRVKYGDLVYVDPTDARDEQDVNRSTIMFIKIVQQPKPIVQAPAPPQAAPPPKAEFIPKDEPVILEEPEPVKVIERKPVKSKVVKKPVE